MKPELSQLNAYEIREEKRLDDIHSDGILLVHKKSGARICVMSNEDVNKVFYIAFRTPPKDSTVYRISLSIPYYAAVKNSR